VAVLSVDLGGSHIGCAVVRNDNVLAELSMPTPAVSLLAELSSIEELLRICTSQNRLSSEDLDGIAIGLCGIVDRATGEILSNLNKYSYALRSICMSGLSGKLNFPCASRVTHASHYSERQMPRLHVASAMF
jgi:predicted NBD/HSP70 family sugar kinase